MRDRPAVAWSLVVVLAGCGAHRLSVGGGAAPTLGASGGTSGYVGGHNEATSDIRGTRVDPAPVYLPDGRLDKRAESGKLWTVLEGFTPAEATQRAVAAGYPGRIEVRPLAEYDASCKAGLVCRAEPFRWELDAGESSTSEHLSLFVNPSVSISKPE
jgi:hypothetical protein